MVKGVHIRYEGNPDFPRVMLNSGGVMRVVNTEARNILARANGLFGAGYQMKPVQPGRNRPHAIVYTGDRHAMRSNAYHNTLLKAMKG